MEELTKEEKQSILKRAKAAGIGLAGTGGAIAGTAALGAGVNKLAKNADKLKDKKVIGKLATKAARLKHPVSSKDLAKLGITGTAMAASGIGLAKYASHKSKKLEENDNTKE